jgi:hypothetical protein
MLHYNPRHVSSINMPIFRRTNCINFFKYLPYRCVMMTTLPIWPSNTTNLLNPIMECLYVNFVGLHVSVIHTTIIRSVRAKEIVMQQRSPVLSQHLVSSLSVNGCTVCRMRETQSLLSSGILYSRLHRVTIPDAVLIQFVLLKMGMLMLETCRGL